jgi:hypothetical protein
MIGLLVSMLLLLLQAPLAPTIPTARAAAANPNGLTFTLVERQGVYSSVCTSTGASVTFGTSTTSGELIVLQYFAGVANGTVVISDSGSETYTRAWTDLTNVASHETIGTSYFAGSASGITSIKITNSASTYCGFVVEHWKRSSGSWTVDQTGTTSATGVATPWSSPAVTTTSATELLIGSVFAYESTGSCVETASGSWNGLAQQDGTNGHGSMLLDQTVTSIQTGIQATGTTTGCTTFGGAGNYPGIVTFK